MIRLLCLAIGYLFGLFQTSYILGRVHGIDIREYGSHNAGTTNMLRTMGLKAGLLTFAGDCGKCILAVVLVRVVFGKTHADILPLLEFYAAAGTILGHNYPFYLGFRGGKGIAATAGLVLSVNWIMAICGIITFFTTFFVTHYVSLGSLLVYVGIVIEVIVLGQNGFFARRSISATRASASTSPCLTSVIKMITSAVSIAICACSRICDRMISLLSGSIPPVSIMVKFLPSHSMSA